MTFLLIHPIGNIIFKYTKFKVPIEVYKSGQIPLSDTIISFTIFFKIKMTIFDDRATWDHDHRFISPTEMIRIVGQQVIPMNIP